MSRLILHPKQKEIIASPKRFKVVRAGRRGGKTVLEVEDMSFTAVSADDMPVFYIAPTQKQAREIVWETLKKRLHGIGKPNESLLEMKVPTQDGGYSTISVAGWENRENFRGKKAKKIVFDEVDTMRDFFLGWQEIFRSTLMDLSGGAVFIGTPKKENPNLRRLEKLAETDSDYGVFHYSSWDNPHIDRVELEKAKAEMDYETYKQEIMAEYIDDKGALFSYNALLDTFTNTLNELGDNYLSVDIADDGSDKTIFSFWRGLEEYKQIDFSNLNTEDIVREIRNYASEEQIPYSNIIVDAIGVGAGVASNSLLKGIIGFKGSYSAVKTDYDIVRLPNKSYNDHFLAPRITDFKNLRSQCLFFLADYVNHHRIASKIEGAAKEHIIEELRAYQDASKGDGKRMVMPKSDVKEIIGRSPDRSDTWQMRMYFEILKKASDEQDELSDMARIKQSERFIRNRQRANLNDTR